MQSPAAWAQRGHRACRGAQVCSEPRDLGMGLCCGQTTSLKAGSSEQAQ